MESLAALGMEILELDVTDIEAIQKMKAEISTRTGGKLDVLVNNAGQTITAAAADADISSPLLIASGKGCVVNTGSLASVIPTPYLSHYNATKAALRAFGNTLRIELAPFNIKVVDLMTGQVKSNVMKPYSIPDGSLYKPVEAEYLATLHERPFVMPAAEYARIVVSQVDTPKPPRTIWAGKSTTMAWFMVNFLPSFIMCIGADVWFFEVASGRYGQEKCVAAVA
ncbi:NADPH-dependent 1-acyldihydroxyacetone phosphate reductase [Mycena sanguinolenta]|uniref:NADPH-dependent 1-acyldihydroxyacetone phosphate reductase n=1 Tax=Mycena sanguinolenta TaxID=230812 RepID=A0A8H6YPU6_9AGAR|nr:NADPH-dependent 1-acyldihydroxyacetone phosphate reductase [Mycena sanguinolenta]